MAADDTTIPYTTTLVIDAAMQREVTRALFLAMFRGPRIWILIAALLLIVAGFSLRGSGALPAVVLWVVLIGFVTALRAFSVRRVVRVTYPIGKQLRSGFGAEHFVISDGDNSSVMAYSGFDQIDVGRAIVWLRRAAPRRRMLYPRGLFPEADLSRMQNTIGAPTIAASSAGSPPPTPGTPA